MGKVPTKKVAKSKIIPLGDRVLIKPLSLDEIGARTASGIIIPETIDKEKSERGEVIAVGEGKFEDGKLVPPSVSIGDRVLFSWGREVKIDGNEYMLVKGEDILAILT